MRAHPALRPVRSAALLALLAAAGAPRGAGAQAPDHDGPFATAAFGAGSAGLSCAIVCPTSRHTVPVPSLTVGATLDRRLRVGAEALGWHQTLYGITATAVYVGGVAELYPTASGFHVKGSAGLAHLSASYPGIGTAASNALGLLGGAGWDLRVARGVRVTPFAEYVRTIGATVTYAGLTLGKVDADVFAVGIGVSVP